MPQNILFVCTGNTCRSPMAEGLLKKWALETGTRLTVQSAGLAAIDGVPATTEAVEAALEKGIDLSGHLSRPLGKAEILESDLILTMTQRHKEMILKKLPDLKGKVFLLSEYAGMGIEDVEDPIGQPLEVYRRVFEKMEGYLLKSAGRFGPA